MYIKSIKLKNIRGFHSLEFDLTRNSKDSFAGWTVFAGDNGSGKSTLLKAIIIALAGKDIAHSLQPSFKRWVSDGEKKAEIVLELVRCADDDSFGGGKGNTRDRFEAKIEISEEDKEPKLSVNPKNSLPNRSVWSSSNKARGWFSCGYGPFRRIFGSSSNAVKHMTTPSTSRYVTMFLEDASLAEADSWLKQLNYKKLEKDSRSERQLDVLLRIIGDGLLPDDFQIDHVDSDGLWLRDRHDVVLSWFEISDGYRAALALMIDIMRHLFESYYENPSTGNDQLDEEIIQPISGSEDARFFINRSGVVLIDEIDAHLHPEWQQRIGFWLKKHFPKIQFLVTTHSPIICQAADPRGLFHLPEPGSDKRPFQLSDEDYNKVIMSRPDTILLSPVFGLQNSRSPLAVAAIEKYSAISAKKRAGATLTEDEQQLVQESLFGEEEP